HEDALLAGQGAIRAQDLLIGDDVDPAAGVLHRLEGGTPRCRVPDLDRGRDRARLLDDAVLVDRRRARGLETDHPRQLAHAPGAVVFAVAAPVRGDVAGVADGDQMVVRRATELITHLEGAGLLSLEPERI